MPDADSVAPDLVLDLSRLLSRARHDAPTGIDRVELAYARELLRQAPGRVSFAAVHPVGGRYGRLPRGAVLRFLSAIEQRWDEGAGRGDRGALARRWRQLRLLWALRPRRVPRARGRRVLIQSSPHHLDYQPLVDAILRREGAHLVCLLHDLIPIAYPEYARPGEDRRHLARIRTVAGLAAGVVANSQATLDAFRPYLVDAGRSIPMAVAHLGLEVRREDEPGPVADTAESRPYFVCIGTIEPRKNHLLLLHVWRQLAELYGPHAIPKLVVVGRRGWENEQVVDLLERCAILRDCVEECGRVTDTAMARLLVGACALLLPSFAEGYGMPVPEALAAGVPVLCSNLAALREAGGAIPEYLDPLDGPGWIEGVLAYADANSPRRQAQLARLRDWKGPSWRGHVETVLRLANEVSA